MTASSAPGSSSRCVAPATIWVSISRVSWRAPFSFISTATGSSAPMMSSTGAHVFGSASAARLARTVCRWTRRHGHHHQTRPARFIDQNAVVATNDCVAAAFLAAGHGPFGVVSGAALISCHPAFASRRTVVQVGGTFVSLIVCSFVSLLLLSRRLHRLSSMIACPTSNNAENRAGVHARRALVQVQV